MGLIFYLEWNDNDEFNLWIKKYFIDESFWNLLKNNIIGINDIILISIDIQKNEIKFQLIRNMVLIYIYILENVYSRISKLDQIDSFIKLKKKKQNSSALNSQIYFYPGFWILDMQFVNRI